MENEDFPSSEWNHDIYSGLLYYEVVTYKLKLIIKRQCATIE